MTDEPRDEPAPDAPPTAAEQASGAVRGAVPYPLGDDQASAAEGAEVEHVEPAPRADEPEGPAAVEPADAVLGADDAGVGADDVVETDAGAATGAGLDESGTAQEHPVDDPLRRDEPALVAAAEPVDVDEPVPGDAAGDADAPRHGEPDEVDEPAPSGTDDADVPVLAGEPGDAAEPVPGAQRAGAAEPVPSAEPRGDADPLQPDSTAAASTVGGWTALGQALRPRLTKAQLLAGVLCAVLGFALVVQVQHHGGTSLQGMRQADLVRMLDETTDRGDALARQESNLISERDELLSGSDRRQAALDALRRTATTQGILTGRLPAEGPGVIITLTEPDGAIRPLTMLDVLEELRNAGAEAIQLNGHRITASSAFTGVAGAVVLDGATLKAPFTWIAIGEPDAIAPALQIPGGAMAAVRADGGEGSIARENHVEVSAVRVVPDPVYATPVPVATR